MSDAAVFVIRVSCYFSGITATASEMRKMYRPVAKKSR